MTKRTPVRAALITVLLLATPLCAQPLEPLPEPPLMEEDESFTPEITTTIQRRDTLEKYRTKDRLYMVWLTPTRGKPYFLIDQHGNGIMTRQHGSTKLSTPMWVLHSW